jgi:hypothetical protein
MYEKPTNNASMFWLNRLELRAIPLIIDVLA